MKSVFAVILFLSLFQACSPVIREDEKLIENLMRAKDPVFKPILDSLATYEVQIIYTQINRDEKNVPSFRTFLFNVDSTHYFYPASTVKLPMVLLALQKINQLSIEHLDKYTPMLHDSVYAGQVSVHKDTTSENNMASVAHYAKKILVVSDNDAYNRLYEFVGQEETNKELHAKGYAGTHLVHRLERPLSLDENAHTEAITFFQKHGAIYKQPGLFNTTPYTPSQKVLKGKGYIKNDSLVQEPFDFSYKNVFPLQEQHKLLQSIIFPSTVPAGSAFMLTDDDRTFVLKYMSQLPTETNYPPYYKDTINYSDAYCKFFLFGGKGSIPSSIRIFNKVGDAYGFLIDNAYIVDFDKGIEFMLSAVIHVNNDGIYNDGNYEYDKTGYPFFKNLGNLIYEYETKRKRRVKPDLKEFKFEYDLPRKKNIN